MICSKCGKELNEQNICEICNNLNHEVNNMNSNKNNNKLIKIILIISLVVLLMFGGYRIYKYFNVSEVLKWNELYDAYNIKYVNPVKVLLGIEFSNENELKNLEYDVTCGKYEISGYEIKWDLTESSGKCVIKVKYQSKEIEKELYVIKEKKEEIRNDDFIKNDEESYEDLDSDGLTNKQEKEYKTDINFSDTDLDGLDDYYEIFNSKTDPTKFDSDNDGLSDYSEIALNLDPNKIDSLGDGIKDGNRKVEYSFKTNGVEMNIKGSGNIPNVSASILLDDISTNKNGMLNKLYSFKTDGNIDEAYVTISYDINDIEKYKLDEDTLSIYYYNTDKDSYEKIETNIDKKNKQLTATLKHFSYYVIGDSTLDSFTSDVEILLILDNSWSMYSDEQVKKYSSFDDKDIISSSFQGYDKEGLRFKLSSNLINKFNDSKYKIGLSEFRKDYANIGKVGSDKSTMTSRLSNMMGVFVTKEAGTNISGALNGGLGEFSSANNEKYIIILTDGEDNVNLSSKRNEIIQKANDKKIHICSIGFGESQFDLNLKAISTATGCNYYSSTSSKGLSELFDKVTAKIEKGYLDLNEDGNIDSKLLADSGFVVNRDGFSFGNYVSVQSSGGHCFGMATLARLYYMKKLTSSFFGTMINEEFLRQFNFKETPFENYKTSLYDYNLRTKALMYDKYLGDIFGVGYIREVKDNTLKYTEINESQINDSGIYDILSFEGSGGYDVDTQLKMYGTTFNNFEIARLNEIKMQNSQMNTVDLQLLNAIYDFYQLQAYTKTYASDSLSIKMGLVSGARDVLGTLSFITGDDKMEEITVVNDFIPRLTNLLNSGDPVVIGINSNHAINAINIYEDIDKKENGANVYHIGVYDNNRPGSIQYVDVKCSFLGKCKAMPNEYYTDIEGPLYLFDVDDSINKYIPYFN